MTLTNQLIETELNIDITSKLLNFEYKIIVLDDDPTGTQTVKDLPVYTKWSIDFIEDGFKQNNPMFYILTNSRALNETETVHLHNEISHNIEAVSDKLGIPYIIISRGDSTLRGHYYLEPETLHSASKKGYDAVFYIPAFFEGNRYTYEGVHYIKEKNQFIPVNETEFANDTTFGFHSKTLKDYINEKSNKTIPAEDVIHITLDDIRTKNKQKIIQTIKGLNNFDQVIVDALNDQDLNYFVYCLIEVLNTTQKQFIFRSAASFVKAMCTTKGEIINLNSYPKPKYGGVIVVGSHVNKTTEQLNTLINNSNIIPIEFDVNVLNQENLEDYIQSLKLKVETYIKQNQDVVIYTSREVIRTGDLNNNLNISKTISESLVNLVSTLTLQPKFIISKGGITSSDIATIGLNIEKAVVLGQVMAGVPVWLTGDESKYPNMPYIIFPGNVGDSSSLLEVYLNNK